MDHTVRAHHRGGPFRDTKTSLANLGGITALMVVCFVYETAHVYAISLREFMLTARGAAEHLRCSVQYVRRLLQSGRMRGRKVGRDWVVEETDMAHWLAVRAAVPLFHRRGDKTRSKSGLGVDTMVGEVKVDGD